MTFLCQKAYYFITVDYGAYDHFAILNWIELYR